jgi:hypothetical protein
MEDIDIPRPNPFITEWLRGELCRGILTEAGELYQSLYHVFVAKRTGQLAFSAAVDTDIEGDRWVAVMSVGDNVAPYAASHEFGTGRTNPDHALPGAHDLNLILDLVATA